MNVTTFRARQSDRRQFLQACGAAVVATVPATAALVAEKSTKPSHLVRFGHTDLFVSRLCQGTAFRKISRRADEPGAPAIFRACFDAGVNFFDTAEAYGWGGSEGAIGKAIKGRRDQVVVCTKATPHQAPENDPTPDKFKVGKKVILNREVLLRKCEGSLTRLETDYIDLFLVHSPDDITQPEEIADSMDALVKAGKVRYWGVSNFEAEPLARFIELRKRQGKTPIAGTEDYYNIVSGNGQRRAFIEGELFPLFRKSGIGLMAFSPLEMGDLAPNPPLPPSNPNAKSVVVPKPGERVKPKPPKPFGNVVSTLDSVAKELGATRPQVCIAWVLSHPEVTVCLAGAECPEHVHDNVPGTRLKLPAEALAKLNAASDEFTRLQPKKKDS